jgi:hypothetical protein
MKKILLAALTFLTIQLHAQFYFVDLTNITVVGGMTIVGDSLPLAFSKINTNLSTQNLTNAWLSTRIDANTVAIVGLNTTLTNFFGTNTVVRDFYNFLSTNTPGGGGGSLPTNLVSTSSSIVSWSTNYVTWGASNYLARVHGFYHLYYNAGNDGGNPPMDYAHEIRGSYDGVTGWFVITNGFQTTNDITLVSTNVVGGFGSGFIQSVDHLDRIGVTNQFFGQRVFVGTPTDDREAAPKGYVDGSIANAFDGHFITSTDTNNVYHLYYQKGSVIVADFANTTMGINIASFGIDGTGTNAALAIMQTNLVPGYLIESTTNLLLNYSWLTATNYSLSTNTGVVTFTIPINFDEPMRFYRARGLATNSVTFNAQVVMNGGTLYPSNTWSLSAITNQMPNKSFWVGPSNGLALVSVSLSNGVARIKQLAP